jgi:hypothetical protein
MTLVGSVGGTWTASTSASGGVDLTSTSATTALAIHAHNDFNGDSLSDILWRQDSGVITDWLSKPNNGGISDNGANFWLNLGTSWHVAGTGDFNGDGRVDMLVRNDNGTVTEYLGQANGSLTASPVTFNPGTDWQVVGIGDFNGDGRDDILWRHGTGIITDWLGQANGYFTDNSSKFYVDFSTQWQVVGTGDFNGDGVSDILWRHSSGVVTDYLGNADGTFTDNAANLWLNPGTNWSVVGTGDFNGDGITDMIWRDQSGVVTDYLGTHTGGMTDNAAHFWFNPGTSWAIVGTGDYNGDGIDDIMWRHSSGVVTDYLGNADGSFTDNAAHLWINPGTSWHPQDTFTHDPFNVV